MFNTFVLFGAHQVDDIFDLVDADVLLTGVDPISPHHDVSVHRIVEQRRDHQLAPQVLLEITREHTHKQRRKRHNAYQS